MPSIGGWPVFRLIPGETGEWSRVGMRDRVEGGFEQNQGVGPDVFLQKQAGPHEPRSLAEFPVIFRNIPCWQGIWLTHSEWESLMRFEAAGGRSERVRPAGCKSAAYAARRGCRRV